MARLQRALRASLAGGPGAENGRPYCADLSVHCFFLSRFPHMAASCVHMNCSAVTVSVRAAMALESGGQMDPRQWQNVRLGGGRRLTETPSSSGDSGSGDDDDTMQLGPGMVYTLCANNTIAPAGTTMIYTAWGGAQRSQSISELRHSICDAFFASTIDFDGDDPYGNFDSTLDLPSPGAMSPIRLRSHRAMESALSSSTLHTVLTGC